MRHEKARQRKDLRWDYTSTIKNRAYPIGYCCGEVEPNRTKYHVDGHATAEEACACYRRYLIDHVRYDRTHPDEQRRCQAPDCSTWTIRTASGQGMWAADLCDAHCNQETVERIYPEVHEAWVS